MVKKGLAAALIAGLLCGLTLTVAHHAQSESTSGTAPQAESLMPAKQAVSSKAENYPVHSHITTTVFWVGEPASADNNGIANRASAWDSQWAVHYGGIDSPVGRKGYLPAGFLPKENPFYVALPYSDFGENSQRKANALNCSLTPAEHLSEPYSWCKNSWLEVTNEASGKACYGQWEDAGPYGENDSAYVFGTANPSQHHVNNSDVDAALDVSPALRDCLGLGDAGVATWRFVPAMNLPGGPWTDQITTSLGDHI